MQSSAPHSSVRSTPPTLAIVIPCFNEEATIEWSSEQLLALLNDLKKQGVVSKASYLYFVDDGSSDRTWDMLATLNMRHAQVHALKLSRNFGHQNALLAGLMSVMDKCEITISIDVDLQQDPAAMFRFIEAFSQGAEIVFGVRNDRSSDSRAKKATASWFYGLMRALGVNIIPNHADYRLLSNAALHALADHPEPNPLLRALCAQLGFKSAIVMFDVSDRKLGSSKYSFRKMLKLGVGGVTSFSAVPLRLIAALGVLIFSASCLMSLYILFRTLVIGDTVPGWASITLPIYFLGGIQLLCMGIIGEYLANLAEAVKRRPRYIKEVELS